MAAMIIKLKSIKGTQRLGMSEKLMDRTAKAFINVYLSGSTPSSRNLCANI